MSSEVKKTRNTQKQSMVEIAFMDMRVKAVIKEGEKAIEELTNASSMKEAVIHQDSIYVELKDHLISKDGNRFDSKTGKLLGIKESKTVPEKMKKEWEAKKELHHVVPAKAASKGRMESTNKAHKVVEDNEIG